METWQSTVGLCRDRNGHLQDSHHCCLVTAGEGTHELSLPSAGGLGASFVPKSQVL